MKNKGVLIVVGILILVVVAIIILLSYPKENGGNLNNGSEEGNGGGVIGGQEDSHGCLIGAGYSWNESVFACVREWELDSDERKAANIAIMPLNYYVTVTEVNKQKCEGCYSIKLQRNDNREMVEISLENWQLADGTDKHKNYCTEEQRKAQFCTMEYTPVCGWFDGSIQCVKYPCAQTYSNICMACSESKVDYWTDGECPK